MLARENRIVKAVDFRITIRKGTRHMSRNIIVHRKMSAESSPVRFGFIVTRKVGNAVERNLIRRRLRAICREIVTAGGRGSDVVVRVLPSAARCSWDSLSREIHTILDKNLIR